MLLAPSTDVAGAKEQHCSQGSSSSLPFSSPDGSKLYQSFLQRALLQPRSANTTSRTVSSANIDTIICVPCAMMLPLEL